MNKNELDMKKLEETTGEELIQEYMSQDKDNTHNMGYSVYAQTHSDGCCC